MPAPFNVWQVLRHVLRYAYEHNAITAVPTDAIDRTTAKYAVGDGNAFEHKPVTGPQVAALMGTDQRVLDGILVSDWEADHRAASR